MNKTIIAKIYLEICYSKKLCEFFNGFIQGFI